MNEHLDAVYRATAYAVEGPKGRFTIRIDEPTPPLDALLIRHGTRCWAFVTACNPGSMPLAPEENQRRQAELERMVSAAGYPFLPGEGVGADATWPSEASLLILGIATEDAAALGRHFEQNAIVVGTIGEPARLLWLGEPPGLSRRPARRG